MADRPSPSVSVIIPVYNESRTIDALLRRVSSVDRTYDIIVVDDGSEDGTSEILEGWRAASRVRILKHAKNLGKGTAIRTGLASVRTRIAVVQDADLEYDPNDIPKVVGPLISGKADLVFGSRRLNRGLQFQEWLNPFFHGVTALNWVAFLVYGIRVSDEATCYKAAKTDDLRAMQLACERFEFCPEVTAKSARMKLRIAEVPISYARRSVGQGKKIRLRDWFHAVSTLWKWRSWQPAAPLRNRLQLPHSAGDIPGAGQTPSTLLRER